MTSDNGYKMNEEVYRSLPQGTVKFLGRAAEDGRILCITKDLLFDYAELSPHKWEEKIIKEPTAEQEGELIQVCAVCGKEDKEIKKIPKIEDEDKDSDEDVDEADAAEELEEADGLNDEENSADNDEVAQAPATPELTPEQIAAINAELMRIEQENCEHTYVVSESSGETVYTCSKCGRTKTKKKKVADDDDDEPAAPCEHDWQYSHVEWVDRGGSLLPDHVHKKTCSICGKSETETSRSFRDATNKVDICPECWEQKPY